MADKEKLIWLLCNAHSKSCEASAFDGISYAEQLSMEADFLLENGVTFAKDTNVPSWIPVTERLPTPYVDVITCRRDFLARATTIGKEYITIRDNEIPSWSQDYRTWKSKVTHWMPLPEPPK